MPCLFAQTMTMENSLWANTISAVQELLANQSDRWADVSPGAKALDVYIWPIIISTILYLPICWSLKAYYKDRKPFPYRNPVILWNVVLSALSALGSAIVILYQPDIMLHKADPRDNFVPHESGVHPYVQIVVRVFCITKIIEYGDTFWLCVKKRPTIFLHLYHHITVSLYCLHSVRLDATYGHFFAFVNLNIHAVMYGYYAAAIAFKGNKFLNAMRPFITLSQLSQMFFGTAICIHEMVSSNKTDGLEINAFFGFIMYVSYAYLFGDFFVKNYKKNLSSIDTLFAVSPVCFLPLILYTLGWSELLFIPSTTAAAVGITMMVGRLLHVDVMSLVSPIYFSAEETRLYGVEAKAIRCMAKKVDFDNDSYQRMLVVSTRYLLLPCVAILIDSVVTAYLTLRSVPMVCLVWCIHGMWNGAWSEEKPSVKKNDDVITENSQKIEDIPIQDKENLVVRRTVPVCSSAK